MGGPDGGDGGRGGHVIFRGDHDEDSLLRLFYMPQVRGGDGVAGRGQQRHGRNGHDLYVPVPCGTQVYDAATGALLADITEDRQEDVIARGGRGGWGNVHWKRSTHQAPTEFTPGLPGDEFRLRLELKLLADAGFVGCPNAGKSSLLRVLTDAHPKVGAYPFTTIHPVVGTMIYPDYSQIRLADIPGLIEGAHAGVGLGVAFLRHLARSRVLVYVIDMAGGDGRLPWADYRALRRELAMHDPQLPRRPSIVVANKMDLPEAAANLVLFRTRTGRAAIPVSAQDGTGLDVVRKRLFQIVRPIARGVPAAAVPAADRAGARDDALPQPSDAIRDAEVDEHAAVITPERLRQAGFLSLAKPRRHK